MANSAESDQLASSELFAEQDISGFSRTRVLNFNSDSNIQICLYLELSYASPLQFCGTNLWSRALVEPLKHQAKFVADDILIFFLVYFTENKS